MKERLEFIMKENEREMQELTTKIKRAEWQLKYAFTMTAYTKEDVEEMKEQLVKLQKNNKRLMWVLEG